MRILKIIAVFYLIFIFYQGNSQTLKIDSTQAFVGDTASIAINMTALDSVGTITLHIGYDTTKLCYIDTAYVNPLANRILINEGRDPVSGARLGKVSFSWVTTNIETGVNFNSGLFAVIRFKVLTGNCPIVFLNNSEISDYKADAINVSFINGNLRTTSLFVQNNIIEKCNVFPNPFYDNITLDIASSTFIDEINIFDISGKIVKQITINEISQQIFIPQLNELKTGTYFIEIISRKNDGITNNNKFKLLKK